MNNTSLMALRQTEPVATPPGQSKAEDMHAVGVLMWTALTVALSNQQWRHLPMLLAATTIAGLNHLPLSTIAASEDDNGPVPPLIG